MRVKWDWHGPLFRFTSSELHVLLHAFQRLDTPEAQVMAEEVEDVIDSLLARDEGEDE